LELGNTTLTKAFLAAAHAFESRLLREQTSLSFESYSMKQESVGIGSTEQSFILPPVFFENLNGLSTNSAPQVSSETIEAILRDYGFLTEDGSGAQFDAASGRLVLSEGSTS